MTQKIWVPEDQIVPLPQTLTPLQAVMLEPLGVAIHAVDLAKPRLLERVSLLGCGPIGLLILQVLKAAGAGEILAVDPQAHRREMALKLGATQVASSIDELRTFTKGEGTPLVVEATNSPDGFREAVLAARIGGRLTLVGIPDGDTYTLPAAEARRRGLKIKFSRRMGNVYPRAIDLVTSGTVNVDTIVSHSFLLAETPDAFRKHAENAPGFIKSLIYPNGLSATA
jgi:L-iditol 2-dehydrogenase